MRNIFVILLVVGIGLSPAFAIGEEAQPIKFDVGVYDAEGELISVKAKGLVCEFCAKALEKVLMRQEQVSGVRVDLTTKEILISLKASQTIENERLEKLVIDAGYNIGEIKRNVKEEKDGASQ